MDDERREEMQDLGNEEQGEEMVAMQITVGGTFSTAQAARKAIMNYSLRTSTPYAFKNNKANNIQVFCPSRRQQPVIGSCNFCLSINKRRDGLLHVVKFISHDENCPTFRDKFRLRGSVIADFAAPLMQDVQGLQPRDIINRVRTEIGAEINYMAAWRIREVHKKHSAQNYAFGFQKLQSLLDALEVANTGSSVALDIDNQQRFHRVFVCLGAWKHAAAYCRPVYTTHVAHSKTMYKGVLLGMSGVDGEGHLVPIAFAIVPIENCDNWTWFFQHIVTAMPFLNSPSITVISDRDKGIDHATTTKLSEVSHGACVWHIERNIDCHFKTKLNGKIWAAAKALTIDTHMAAMSEIRMMHAEAHAYLAAIPRSQWTLSHARSPRFGVLTSNMSEATNSWIHDVHNMEPFEAIVELVRKTGALFFERRMQYANVSTFLPRTILSELQKRTLEGRTLQVIQTDTHIFEVRSSNLQSFRVVNLTECTCSCGEFWQYQFPCIHACAAASKACQEISWLSHKSYTTNNLRELYARTVVPVDVDTLQADGVMLPPVEIRESGSPQKIRLRIRGQVDPEDQITCSKCGVKGHNMRTCDRRRRHL